MAYGTEKEDAETPPALSGEEADACFRPVEFGIAGHGTGQGIGIENADAIDEGEASEISLRRYPPTGCFSLRRRWGTTPSVSRCRAEASGRQRFA